MTGDEAPRRGEPGFHEAAVNAFVDGFLGDWDGTITVGPPVTADRICADPILVVKTITTEKIAARRLS